MTLKMRVTLPHRDTGHLAGLRLSEAELVGIRARNKAEQRRRDADARARVMIATRSPPKHAGMPVVDLGPKFRAELAEAERRGADARRQETAANVGQRATEAAASWDRTLAKLGWPAASKSN